MSVPAVFLDRDGVLCEERGHLRGGDALSVFPFAAGAVRTLHDKGYLAVVVTNQSAVARGLITEAEVEAAHRELMERTGVDAVYHCPHLEGGSVARYAVRCECRKPRTGMIDRACKDLDIDRSRSWFVGDRASDIQAGIAAGLRTVLLESGYGTARLEAPVRPDHVMEDLEELARSIPPASRAGADMRGAS